MSYTVRAIRGRNAWLTKPFAGRDKVIAGVMIHATRGGSTVPDYDDLAGTENWAESSANGSAAQGWGSYWDELIGRATGERVISTDWDTEYATWCAGYGDVGTWAAGIYYIQIELAQSRSNQPYTVAQIDSAAQSVAEKSKRYNFPLVRIPYLAQVGTPPRGICTHEDSANGRRTGKSDPGPLFPWAHFLERARHYAGEVDEVTREEFEALKQRVDDIHGALVKDIWGSPEYRAELKGKGVSALAVRMNEFERQEGWLDKRMDAIEDEAKRQANELARHTSAPHTADGLRGEMVDAFGAAAAFLNGED